MSSVQQEEDNRTRGASSLRSRWAASVRWTGLTGFFLHLVISSSFSYSIFFREKQKSREKIKPTSENFILILSNF
jgi:hypothetical protein